MLEDKSNSRTPISDLGKHGLIKYLTGSIELQNKTTIKGVGDDAAVIDYAGEKTLVTTGIYVENVYFNLAYTPLKHLGYKVIVSAISNLVAMNAIPQQVLISIAVSNRFPVEALEEIYQGITTACKFYKIDLAGGDTTSSNLGLIINVTALAKSKKEEIIYRNGAKENDLIVVSGDLGAAYFGLQVLERENSVFKVNPNFQPDLDNYTYLLQRHLKPEARTDIKKLLKEMDIKPTSMIDISEGLASEIISLSKVSNVGFSIYEDKIPMDNQTIVTAEEFGINPVTGVLNGGEDYEILFTIPLTDLDKIKGNPNFSVIGHVTKDTNNVLITKAGQQISLSAQGWNENESSSN